MARESVDRLFVLVHYWNVHGHTPLFNMLVFQEQLLLPVSVQKRPT